MEEQNKEVTENQDGGTTSKETSVTTDGKDGGDKTVTKEVKTEKTEEKKPE